MAMIEKQGRLAIYRLENSPVNAINEKIRWALAQAILAVEQDNTVDALILIGAQGKFSGGFDIGAFGTAKNAPRISEIALQLEQMAKPSVAVIEGYALGGGLEIALGCRYRLAHKDSKLGLPEVNLGLLPAGGGLQRLLRQLPIDKSLDLMLSGREINGSEGVASGLIDSVFEHSGAAKAIAFAGDFLQAYSGVETVPLMSREWVDSEGKRKAIKDRLQKLTQDRRATQAQQIILTRCLDSLDQTCDVAQADDQAAFRQLQQGAESKSLRYIFKSERRAARGNINHKQVRLDVGAAAVIGAGTMGTGIALTLAGAGFETRLVDINDTVRDRAARRIEQYANRQHEKGLLNDTQMAALVDRIQLVSQLPSGAGIDLVIEAVPENIELKKTVFKQLNERVFQNTILATNTSGLDIDAIAGVVDKPERVIGLHFFSPAEIMPLLEVVRGEKTSEHSLAVAIKLGKRLGKQTVLVGNCFGFAANRCRFPLVNEARLLVEDGASPRQVDAVLERFGFPMGPFRAQDLAGLDVAVAASKSAAAMARRGRQNKITEVLVNAGRLGQKSGGGWYRYEVGSRVALDDAELDGLLDSFRKEQGISARHFLDDEILQRCLLVSVNEAARIVGEGVVSCPQDLDVLWINGFNFPRTKGGLIYWANQWGLEKIARQIDDYYRPQDPGRWPLVDIPRLLNIDYGTD